MSDKNITYFRKIEFSLVFTNYIYLSHIIDIIEQFHPCNIDTEKCVILADICILNSFRNICPLNFSTYNIYYSCFFFPPVDVHRGWMMAMRDLFFKILWHMRMQRERRRMLLCSTWDTSWKGSNCIDIHKAKQPTLILETLNIGMFYFTVQRLTVINGLSD